jgi:hypothetical protein
MLSQPLIEELQEILRTDNGLDLCFDVASKIARELSDYFDLLAEVNYENTKKSNNLINQVENSSDSAIIKQTEEFNSLPK